MPESIRICSDVPYSNDFSLPAELQLQEGPEKSVELTSKKVRNYIHDDLAFPILSKLPLKSLKRFGSVRKSWSFENPNLFSIFCKNLISNQDSYFDDTSLFLQHFTQGIDLFSYERYESMISLAWPNPFQQEEPYFRILNSSSITGILCLYQVPEQVVLWNPSTDEFRVIPPSLNESPPRGQSPFAVLHGFGYDQVNDDYKLIRYVRFFESDYDFVHCIPRIPIKDDLWEIYSLRNNSWRTIDGDKPPCTIQFSIPGELLYKDGMCHWVGIGINGTREDEHAYFLSSFDLSNEAFFATPIPVDIEDDFQFYLLVLNGYIGLMSWNFWGTTFHISILGQIGVKESWTKVFIIGSLPNIGRPFGAWKNGKIFFIKEDEELVLFDLSTQLIEELGVNGVKGEACAQISIYKENLLPIIGGTKNC